MTDDRFVITPEMKAAKEAQENEAAERAASQAAAELEAASNMGPRKGPSPKPEAKTPWPQQNIPIKDIDIGKRLRPLDEKEVEEKAKSITEVGLLNAITVSVHPTKPTTGTPPRHYYLLRAGLHRLEACKQLKWKEVPAVITTLAGPRASLIEVDENLMQTTLTPAQRAVFTKKRKELYEALYPDAVKGKAQGEGMKRSAAAEADGKVCSEVDKQAPSRSYSPGWGLRLSGIAQGIELA